MDDRDLLMLRYLNKYKSVTKAANALFITQPALTVRVRSLERELDTKILHSSHKGIVFTQAGLELVAYADSAIRRLDGLKGRLRAMESQQAGLVRIVAPYIICYYYMPEIIKAFKAKYPQSHFYLQVASSSEIVTLLNRKQFDFGFLRNDFGWEESESLLLGSEHIAAVSLHPFKLQDLPHLKRVAYVTDGYYTQMLELWWQHHFSTQPDADVTVSSLDLCKKMVFSGLGFGILPSVFLQECPQAHYLLLEDKAGKPLERRTRLVYHQGELHTLMTRRFLKFMQAHELNQFFSIA